MKKLVCLVIIFFSLMNWSKGQFNSSINPYLSYDFDDGIKSSSPSLNFEGKWLLANGIAGQGGALDGKSSYISFKPDEEIEAITFSFWFKPSQEVKENYSIIGMPSPEQSKESTFSIGVNQDRVFISSYGNQINECSTPLEKGKWHHFMISLDAEQLQLRIESDYFYCNRIVRVKNDYIGELVIGQCNNVDFFWGVIDELKIFKGDRFKVGKALFDEHREKMYNDHHKKDIVIFKERINEVQSRKELKLTVAEPYFEIWDNDLRDRDKIRIYVNDKFLKEVTLNRKHQRVYLNYLRPKEVNEIIFYASHMGRKDALNTASIEIEDKHRIMHEIKLISDTTKNAVINVFYDPPEEKEEMEYEKSVEVDGVSKVLHTHDTKIRVRMSGALLSQNNQIVMKLDGGEKKHIKIEGATVSESFFLKKGENTLYLKIKQNKATKNDLTLDFENDTDVFIKNSPVTLKMKNNVWHKIKIMCDPRLPTFDSLDIYTDSLTLTFEDMGRSGGEEVSLQLDDEIIHKQLELTKQMISFDVKLDRKKKRQVLLITPTKAGKVKGISCRFGIYDAYTNKKLSEFIDLSTYSKDAPAKILLKFARY